MRLSVVCSVWVFGGGRFSNNWRGKVPKGLFYVNRGQSVGIYVFLLKLAPREMSFSKYIHHK